MPNINTILKAIFGSIIAGLGALDLALTDDALSSQEIVRIAIATAVAFGVVWGVPNAGQDD